MKNDTKFASQNRSTKDSLFAMCDANSPTYADDSDSSDDFENSFSDAEDGQLNYDQESNGHSDEYDNNPRLIETELNELKEADSVLKNYLKQWHH